VRLCCFGRTRKKGVTRLTGHLTHNRSTIATETTNFVALGYGYFVVLLRQVQPAAVAASGCQPEKKQRIKYKVGVTSFINFFRPNLTSAV
jgi:hypothetical protein